MKITDWTCWKIPSIRDLNSVTVQLHHRKAKKKDYTAVTTLKYINTTQ